MLNNLELQFLTEEINEIKILGCYAPNLRMKPVSMYKIKLSNQKNIYLDMGYGNGFSEKLNKLKNSKIIISHNHIDHVQGVLELAIRMRVKNIQLDEKIDIYMPRTLMRVDISNIIRNSNIFNFHFIDENSIITLNEYRITFCTTIHKGESYAVKFENLLNKKTFVYTSDIAIVNKKLIEFIKNADTILMEAGKAENKFSLNGYHATTKYLINSVEKANIGKILITHYKESQYRRNEYNKFLKESKIELVKLNESYNIL